MFYSLAEVSCLYSSHRKTSEIELDMLQPQDCSSMSHCRVPVDRHALHANINLLEY